MLASALLIDFIFIIITIVGTICYNMIGALAIVASSHILFALGVISSLSCTIALLLHEFAHLAHK